MARRENGRGLRGTQRHVIELLSMYAQSPAEMARNSSTLTEGAVDAACERLATRALVRVADRDPFGRPIYMLTGAGARVRRELG